MSSAPFTFLSAEPPKPGGPGRAVFRLNEELDAAAFVRTLVPSKPMAARIFEKGQLIGPDGRVRARTDTLPAGEQVTLLLLPTHTPGAASDAPLTVLHQDPFLLAVDKPAGILVHADGTDAQTLTARVQGLLRRQGSAAVPQALHRLDVDTSGVVLFSLAEETQPAFDALVSGGGLSKRYLAVIEGSLPAPEGEWFVIDAPIARDRHDARRMRVGRTGKPSRTRVRTLARAGGCSLIEAQLETGRRHQIRVHLAHLGHPLVGDVLYGGVPCAKGLQLCAHELRLVHPVTGQNLHITLDFPGRCPQRLDFKA